MPAIPQFFVGDFVSPLRAFRLRDSGGFGLTTESFYDCRGRRTTIGQVTAVTAVPTFTTVQTWHYEDSLYHAVSSTEFLYTLDVWDIDAGAVISVAEYPESQLGPPPTFGPVHARHVSLAALDSDVAAIAAGLAASGDGDAARVLASSGTATK